MLSVILPRLGLRLSFSSAPSPPCSRCLGGRPLPRLGGSSFYGLTEKPGLRSLSISWLRVGRSGSGQGAGLTHGVSKGLRFKLFWCCFPVFIS